MGRPRKITNKHLPDNLRPKTVIRKSGKTVIYWLYRTHGKTEISLGTDRNQAFIKAAQLNIERESKKDYITFGLVAKRYRDEIIPQKKNSTAQNDLVKLKPLLLFFSDAPLEQITAQHIREYMNWRKETPSAANNEFSMFGHIWQHAREWGYTNLPSPNTNMKRFPIRKREIYVEDHIFQMVYEFADQDMKDLMDLAYLTGQRPVDLANLEREHIFDGYLHIVQQKTNAKLRIEIVGQLAEILHRRLETAIGIYLFTTKKGEKMTARKLGKRFIVYREHAIKAYPEHKKELTAFQFRDLRAKSGTDIAMTSGEEMARQQLGHTNIQMTKTYIRKAPIITPIQDSISTKQKG
ncbi:integrase-like protein [Nicoletella semolina]|uniref:Integrase-like protein n=1 Tax=Nicoletella semolina TaxID=271160 RepID=A0A4R2NAH8_9PAST|nr:tyrosine-type recombinase/integrase [Nicoletella semolina]MDH2923977.1 integrase [Nicoletella semolina]TCP18111.1 integrase-like protein [Nicoletella semolina]